MNNKFLKGLVENVNEKENTLSVAVATDSSIDRDGEIVDPAGIDTKNFEKNPVLLWAHDYRQAPIGKVVSIKRDGSRLLFTPEFAVGISEQARQYYEMFKAGILNAFSIGFVPKEWTDRQNTDGSYTRIFTKTELLEISAVPVPANPNALVMVRSIKGIDEKIISEIEKASEEEKKDEPVVEEPKKEEPAKVEEEENKEEKKSVEEIVADQKKEIDSLKEKVEILTTTLADNGVKGKETLVEELLKNPSATRQILTTIDKAVGKALRDLNRSAK